MNQMLFWYAETLTHENLLSQKNFELERVLWIMEL